MLDRIPLGNILFLDIETVPQSPSFDSLNEKTQLLWAKKAKTLRSEDDASPAQLYERAGIYAEFGKIVCISVGVMNGKKARITSFYNDNEHELLTQFARLLNTKFNDNSYVLCGHNGKEFDFPYISRRMLINRIALPNLLNNAGKKPWEIPHLDTLELWKFGDFKNYTSLELLAHVFDIPTPKDDIDGSMVRSVYYDENDLDRIARYCEKDVLTLMQLMLCYKGEALLIEDMVEFVSA
jgi:3'-5' exonuclease